MTTQIPTAELDGWPLDYWTGRALGYAMLVSNDGAGPAYRAVQTDKPFQPTTDIYHVFPVLQRMRAIISHTSDRWIARADGCNVHGEGTTLHLAVCRALVLSQFGASVAHPGIAPVDACWDLFA